MPVGAGPRTGHRAVGDHANGPGSCPLVLLLLAQGFNKPTFSDLAIAFCLFSFPAALLFAHFFERWL